MGGGASARWINAPDNEASTGNLGFLLKFGRQTRIGGDVSLGRVDAERAVLPVHDQHGDPDAGRGQRRQPVGAPAAVASTARSTPRRSTSRSRRDRLENLAIRAQFRSYDLTNKTNRFVITGDVATSPDRDWSVVTPSADGSLRARHGQRLRQQDDAVHRVRELRHRRAHARGPGSVRQPRADQPRGGDGRRQRLRAHRALPRQGLAGPARHLRPGQADGRGRDALRLPVRRGRARDEAHRHPGRRDAGLEHSRCPSRTSAGTSSTRTGRTGSR